MTSFASSDVTPGRAPHAVEIPVPGAVESPLRAGIPICYELLFPDLVRELKDAFERHGLDGEVLLVDDGSTDGTADLAEKEAADWSRFRVLRHKINLGKTEAMQTAAANVSDHRQILSTVVRYPLIGGTPGRPRNHPAAASVPDTSRHRAMVSHSPASNC